MSTELFKKTTTAPVPEQNQTPITETPEEEIASLPDIDELTMLKQRAKLMGVTFSNNIGIDALRAKVNAKAQGDESSEPVTEDEEDDEIQPVAAPETPQTMRQKLQAEQLRLVRVRVMCLDPKKKDLPGEIFTVCNKFIGTVRKYVPFGEQTDNGYHIPYIIYNMMKEREFVQIKTRKTPRGDIVESNMVREFALEILPPLTSKELQDMKASQMSRGDQ